MVLKYNKLIKAVVISSFIPIFKPLALQLSSMPLTPVPGRVLMWNITAHILAETFLEQRVTQPKTVDMSNRIKTSNLSTRSSLRLLFFSF